MTSDSAVTKPKNIDDLQAVRSRAGQAVYYPSQMTVNIGMASCGLAAGARETHQVATELAKGGGFRVCQTGCLGYCEQEPLVEIVCPGRPRLVYKKVTSDKIAEIIEAHQRGQYLAKHVLGRIKDPRSVLEDDMANPQAADQGADEIPFLEDLPFYGRQFKIALRNCGYVDPGDLEQYIARRGFFALAKCLEQMTPDDVVAEMIASGLRGRGGGGFPTGLKWQSCAKAEGEPKYVICNADEGDPGAYMDRSILEGDPFSVLEGMTIAAYAVGARQGFLYVRNEYPLAVVRLVEAIGQAKQYGLLGENILGRDFAFDIKISTGAGAFVCGESTALMRSLEGKVGRPRAKYIHTVEHGYRDKPSNLNNVETFANVPAIIDKGAQWFASMGTATSKGTKVFSLVGKVKNTGLVEVPMGVSLRHIIEDIGGGTPKKPFKAVQTGGPSGGCIPESLLDIPVDYQKLVEIGSMMGSGGMIVMDQDTCMVDVARYFLEFLQEESCGQCTPCREGIKRLLQILTDICQGRGREGDIELLQELSATVKELSLCGLGGSAPNPVLSTIRYFRDEYESHIRDKFCPAGVCKELFQYEIDPEACTGCHVCWRKCPQQAIGGEKKKPHVIDQAKCIKCSICYDACKFNAVVVKPNKKQEPRQ